MRKILLLLALSVWSIGATAQSVTTAPTDVNVRVGQAMNTSDWFELARIYRAEREQIDPFLRCYAESLLATFFGRPAEATMAIERLVGTYGEWLGDGALEMWFYWGINQTMMGEYAIAAEGLARELAKAEGKAAEATIEPLRDVVEQWRELSKFDRVNRLERPAEGDVHVPFRLKSMRPDKGDAQQIRFEAKFNGEAQEVVFDTGASVNVASVEAAERLGLKMLEAESEVHIDFEHSELFSPDVQTLDYDEHPNIYSSPALFEVECEINGERQVVNIDTGASESNLSAQYFATHREQIEREGVLDTLRSAGAGGIKIEQAYALRNVRIDIGGATHTWEKMMCSTEPDIISCAGNIGMDCLTTFSRVVINARTMRLRVEPRH